MKICKQTGRSPLTLRQLAPTVQPFTRLFVSGYLRKFNLVNAQLFAIKNSAQFQLPELMSSNYSIDETFPQS